VDEDRSQSLNKFIFPNSLTNYMQSCTKLICRMRRPSCLAKMLGECSFLNDWWHESQADKETLLGKVKEAIKPCQEGKLYT
jgi:hypothetical protein